MTLLHRTLSYTVAVLLWGLCPLYVVLGDGYAAHDFGRVIQLALLVAGALAVVFRSPGPLSTRTYSIVAVLAALVAMSVAGAAFPAVALREVVLMLGLGLLALALADALTEERAALFLRIVAVGSALYGVVYFALLGGALAQGLPVFTWDLPIGFDNPRFLNHCQTVALPLTAIVMMDAAQPRWARNVAGLGLVLGGAILALLLGRATMVALAAATVVLLCLPATRRFAIAMAGTVLVGGVLVMIVGHDWGQTQGYATNTHELTQSHSRGGLAESALALIRAHPWLGAGPMHYSHWVDWKVAHPHDVYLQWAAEYGLPATGLLLGLIAVGLTRFVRRVYPTATAKPAMFSGVLAALVGLLVDAVFSGNFVMPLPQLWIVSALALALFLYRQQAGTSVPVTNAAARVQRVGASVALASMGILAVVSFVEAAKPVPAIVVAGKTPPGTDAKIRPRYWATGTF